MDKFTLYLMFFVAFFANDVLCKKRGHVGSKIVGGDETTIQNYPYQVSLSLNDGTTNFRCGGSIVNRHYIVTAAHCLEGIQSIRIRIGSTDASSGGSVYKASYFTSHPQYDADTSDYDVGIIRVSQGMALDSTNARSIRLARSGTDVADGDIVTISGWGITSENGPETTILNVVQVPAVNRTSCRKQLKPYRRIVTRRMFCAGLPEGGKDHCYGDSGSPAVVDGVQVGIVSYGAGCARPHLTGVYCRVGNHNVRSWLKYMTGV